MNNILVTAIGSMSAASVLEQLSSNGDSIVGTDTYPLQWQTNQKFLKKFHQVPKAVEERYIEEILKICVDNGVKYVIPLTDPEIDALSANRTMFENKKIVLCISNPEAISKCRNKSVLEKIFRKVPLVNVIPSLSKEEMDDETLYPIVAKPKNGRSSEGLYLLKNRKWLSIIENRDDYVFQPYIQGQVVTVDVVRDGYGNNVSVARRELIRTFNGMGVVVEIIEDSALEQIVAVISEKLDILGCINIEFLKKDNTCYLMDCNPRFSAGIGFSMFVGYDFVTNHLRCFKNESIGTLVSLKSGVLFRESKISSIRQEEA
ncbi:MAG: ATP-grasp domain-containing protein [Candidatus Accumulibacter sp.]|nr:ATP-grasp domain-containing protein [Accumulibacter sp.]